jgi:hypothetical protein
MMTRFSAVSADSDPCESSLVSSSTYGGPLSRGLKQVSVLGVRDGIGRNADSLRLPRTVRFVQVEVSATRRAHGATRCDDFWTGLPEGPRRGARQRP